VLIYAATRATREDQCYLAYDVLDTFATVRNYAILRKNDPFFKDFSHHFMKFGNQKNIHLYSLF